jgi:hypothetical protein
MGYRHLVWEQTNVHVAGILTLAAEKSINLSHRKMKQVIYHMHAGACNIQDFETLLQTKFCRQ